jgi:hypothetical protein
MRRLRQGNEQPTLRTYPFFVATSRAGIEQHLHQDAALINAGGLLKNRIAVVMDPLRIRLLKGGFGLALRWSICAAFTVL